MERVVDTRVKRESLMVGLGGKRSRVDIEADTWKEVKLVAMGKSYGEVAEIMARENNYEISGEQVRLDVEKALVEWKRQNISAIDAYIAKDLVRIEEIEKIVLEDYERSKHCIRPHEYAVLMKRGMTMEEVDAWFETHSLGGNPAYLDTLLHLQMQRMKLLGIDKGNDVTQTTIVNYSFNGVDDRSLERIADSLQDKMFDSIADEQ